MHLTTGARRPFVFMLLSGALLSCGGDGPTEPPDVVATKLAFVTAPPGSAETGEALSPQPVVQLQDASGKAVAKSGVVVTASLEGGSVSGGTATTATNGRATFTGLTLTASAGNHTLKFSAPNLAGLEHAISMSAGSTLVISANSAASQTSTAGLPVPQLPSVKIADAAGNPAAGVAVTFTMVAGNGQLVDAIQQSGADGVATVGGWTLGMVPGSNSVRATGQGVSGSVTFSATGILVGQSTRQSQELQVAMIGTDAASAPSVSVTESGAPKAGALVRFRVVSGGGTVATTETTTNAAGVASAGQWELGSAAGENVVEAEVPGYSATAFRFRAWGVNQLPASMELHAGDGQTVDAGQTLPLAPAVRVEDAGGAPLVGFPVTFALADEAAGAIMGANAVTNAQGVAAVGSWKLPLPNGTVHLLASSQELAGSPVEFSATVFDDTPATIEVASGTITAQVATAVAALPKVRVRTIGGDLLQGVQVEFAAAPGSGSLTGASAVTDANGLAGPASWTLGTTAGQQTVTATVASLTPASITATATPGPAAAAVVAQGNNQSGPVYNPLVLDPKVRVEDQYGNAVAGVRVDFGVTLGGGRIIKPTQNIFSGANGEAGVRWILGGTTGSNQLTASFPTAPIASLAITATATDVTSDFDIEVMYATMPSAAEKAAVDAAVARWRTIIQGDVDPLSFNLTAGTCAKNQPAINKTVDDLLLLVDFSTIDGAGNVLGSAGPCVIRGGTSIPAFGTITIDGADASGLAASGELWDVMLHELGHVLGIGTVWTRKNLLTGTGGLNPEYTGVAARGAYHSLGGNSTNVPVEGSDAGPGTADSHWRESALANELMTGYIGGSNNPLSRITSRSLIDLGYVIDDATADPLGFAPAFVIQAERQRIPLRQIRERPLKGPIIVIYPDGTTEKVPR